MRVVALAVLGRRAEDRHTDLVVRVLAALRIWRRRIQARRMLTQLDSRTPRDAGIDPMAAQYEALQPVWIADRRLR